MDLTETLETNDAPDRSNVSQSSACKHNDVARPEEPHQQHQSENSTTPDANTATDNARKFGRDVALAMACLDAAERLRDVKATKAEKSDDKIGNTESERERERERENATSAESDIHPKLSIPELSAKLHKISSEIDCHRAELIMLLVQFDDYKGWEKSGARHCADWANAKLGIAKPSVYHFLRAGRALQALPIITSLFRGGELSWSKVKYLTAVADADNERYLADVALTATVSDVERICKEFRWSKHDNETIDPETGRTVADLKAAQQVKNRSVTWHDQRDGSVKICVTLPPEKAQIVLKSLDFCANELYESNSANSNDPESNNSESNGSESSSVKSSDVESNSAESNPVDDTPTATQRRADAMLLMAERSLQYAGTDVSRSDRYQVVLHLDNRVTASSKPTSTESNPFPSKVPWIEGVGPVADSVASRIACDASIVSILMQDGEPLNVGQKTRVWPAAIRRAIMTRDRHCQFPGCSEHRYLDIHHIDPWANKGETSVDNGICLCHRHHTLVHQEGYIIERNTVETDMRPRSKDYGTTIGLVSPAKKALLPTRYRFRFIKPVSGAKASGCCGNNHHNQHDTSHHNQSDIQHDTNHHNQSDIQHENQCNEPHINYRVSPRVNYQVSPRVDEKNEWEFATWLQAKNGWLAGHGISSHRKKTIRKSNIQSVCP